MLAAPSCSCDVDLHLSGRVVCVPALAVPSLCTTSDFFVSFIKVSGADWVTFISFDSKSVQHSFSLMGRRA